MNSFANIRKTLFGTRNVSIVQSHTNFEALDMAFGVAVFVN